MPKLTILGGSSVATPELISALVPHMRDGRELIVALHGRDAGKLQLVGGVCQRMAEAVPGLEVVFTTDLFQALQEADFVLNQVRVGGLEARAYDETFPHRWNIPGEETVGPGGAANAMRTVPVVLDLCQIIERAAPECVLITFSNPSSVVQRAIHRCTRLNVIGLCDAPETMHRTIARSLNVAPPQLDTQYVGMHHFGFITSAQVDGIERLPDVLADDAACNALGIAPEIGRITGVLPHPYFRYFFHPDRMLDRQRQNARPRARELQQLESELLAAYASHRSSSKPEAIAKRSATWYETTVAPALIGLAFKERVRLAVNIPNDGLVPHLADDTVIEATADIIDSEVRPRPLHRLPPPAMFGLLQANAAYEHTLVEAIIHDSSDLLLAALVMNPLTPSYDVARQIVDEVWPRRGWPPEPTA